MTDNPLEHLMLRTPATIRANELARRNRKRIERNRKRRNMQKASRKINRQ